MDLAVGQSFGIFTVTRTDRPFLPSGRQGVWVRCPKCNREFFNSVSNLRVAKSCGADACRGWKQRTEQTKTLPQTLPKPNHRTKKPEKVPEVAAPGRWNTLEAEAKQAFLSDPHYVEDMARAWHAMLANRKLRAER